MAQLKYLGPCDSVEVPHLNWRVFVRDVSEDVGDVDLGNFREQDCWEVDGVVGSAPVEAPGAPVDTTTPENMPTEAPAEPAPTEGS
jgi:hypothetical protein